MNPISDRIRIERYLILLREMMSVEAGREPEVNLHWAKGNDWCVVPVEPMARLPEPDIPRIVSVLRRAGYSSCISVLNEPDYVRDSLAARRPLVEAPVCYDLSINEADFKSLNSEWGTFRFVVFPEDRSWLVSCSEWYNLFAAERLLVESLLGKPLQQAHRDFLEYASVLAEDHPDSLLHMARQYASL